MPGSTSKYCCRLFLIATLASSLAPSARSTDAPDDTRYPNYDVQGFCRFEVNTRSAEWKHQCEDREYAVAILLKQNWPALTRSEPTLTAACTNMIGYFEAHPSYVSLLQCITRVRDAAD